MNITRTARVFATVGALSAVASPALARPDLGDEAGPVAALAVDVAEVGARPGAVAGGYLYLTGTLTASNGVRADGSPEFPDRVIGRWTALPRFVPGAISTVRSRPATHVFRLAIDGVGATLLTEGQDRAVVAGGSVWSITGGTGRFRAAHGSSSEFVLGQNKARGRNLRVTFDLAS